MASVGTEKQKATTQELIKKLANDVAAAKDFVPLKDAVLEFIENMDTKAHVLGDSEFASLAIDSFQRRGKESAKAFALFNNMAKEAKAGK